MELWYLHCTFTLVLVLWRKKLNADLFQTCFKEHENMSVEKNLRVTVYFYKKHYLQVVTLSHGVKIIN